MVAEQYVVKSWAEVDAELAPVRQAFAEEAKARDAAHEADPNNGTYGLWAVEGIRHYSVVDATSAPEALNKAIAEGEVGDWEQATAKFLRPLTAAQEAPR